MPRRPLPPLPDAPLYTLFTPGVRFRTSSNGCDIRTSFLQRLPRVDRYYRYPLPLMPLAARWRIDPLRPGRQPQPRVAKAARPRRACRTSATASRRCATPGTCANRTSPTASAGSRREPSTGCLPPSGPGTGGPPTASRTSSPSARRPPPHRGLLRPRQRRHLPAGRHRLLHARTRRTPREDYYLVVSAFAPYKRVDLAIEACNRLGRKLVVIGSGQDAERLKALAGPTVQFLGWQPDEDLATTSAACRALLFPGEEDFGIVPVEANACGTPVIAFGRAGRPKRSCPSATTSRPGLVRGADGRFAGRGAGTVRTRGRPARPAAARGKP